MKTPAILFGLILLASFVSAANVTLQPSAVYETTTAWIALDVNNYQGNAIVSRVVVDSPLAIGDAKSYIGWTKVQNGNKVEWKDGTIETNVRSAWFEFKIAAPNVANDTVKTFPVTVDSSSSSLNLTILNDATPPVITHVRPSGYARANNPMHAVSVDVVDAETFIDSVTYSWNDCNGSSTSEVLVKNNDVYNGIANFSHFDEGDKACYVITAKNVPGESSNVSGELLFDGTAPTLTIVSPTAYATETTDFVFTASDNIALVLSCTLSLDSAELRSVNVSNGVQTTVSVDMSGFSQGSHTWSVTCQDGVGLSTTHAQVIQLDTAPPVISLNAASTVARTQSLEFVATVTDTVSLGVVNATFDGVSITLTQDGDKYRGTIISDVLGAKTLVVQAADSAGHIAIVTQTITVVPNHRLSISLSADTVKPGDSVVASGTLTAEGNVSASTVTVKTPDGDFTVDLSGYDYSKTFTAPGAGTYVITAEFAEAGHVYSATATLYVRENAPEQPQYSRGADVAWRYSGYIKPDEVSQEPSSSELVTEEPQLPETAPQPPAYEPLAPVAPREARIAPKATGMFDLGTTVKWSALLLALALVGGLGAYAYSKRKPKDGSGIDWEGYFKNGS